MAFTTVVYSASVETNNALTYLPAVADQHVRVEGNNIIVPRGLNNLIGVYAMGQTITAARLESPSLRRVVNYDVPYLDVAADTSAVPMIDLFPSSPIPLDEDEGLRALVAENVAGAEWESVVVWLADGPVTPVTTPSYTVRATGSTTLAPRQWTNVPLTFAQSLPAGRYQVVGFHARSATAIAARLVFVGGIWRPGIVAARSDSHTRPSIMRHGGLGVWGEFDATQPPSVDFIATGADTSEVVWLDVVPIAAAAGA